jgi:hypothetical protein
MVKKVANEGTPSTFISLTYRIDTNAFLQTNVHVSLFCNMHVMHGGVTTVLTTEQSSTNWFCIETLNL